MRAARYGIATEGAAGGPLLIIAGAGSGKTQTLAHRVAHLIEQGADPGRMLLLTFSRRAAQEMERRAERILAARGMSQGRASIGWSGTFHAIGARLLREFAQSIGLDPAFTIHDREDSADLMNLVRHHLGFSDQAQRFPLKAACLAIYSRAVNSGKRSAWCFSGIFPGARLLRTIFAACSKPMSRPSKASMCSITTISSSIGPSS